jgi:alpha-tubulin suppressor-like RCC1 family protein
VSTISRTVAVIDPPVIATQPANFIGVVGASAQMTVSATGAAPLSYQWYWQNQGAIAGATTATLTWSSLAASNAGAYYVVVSNVYGGTASDKALIVPQGWQLNGINPVTNYINTAYTDPGAALTLPIVAVAAGYTHSLALKAEGTVVAWGANDFGQTSVSAAATNVMAIAAGYWHSLALKTDGTVIGWGDNGEGQTSVPAAATNVVAIAAGWFHNLALKADGTVVAWGDNSDHETSVPAAATNVVAVAGGYYYSLALKADGTVVGWGYNGDGETNVPAAVTNVVAIAAGTVHCLALKADGSVIAWGDNAYGEANVPAAATNVVAVKAGYALSLALKADGTIVAWGLGNYGDTIIPAIATNVVAIAAGYDFGLALKADSTIVGWGNNSDGQTTIPSFAQPTLMSGGTVNTAVAGTYTLTYNYTNSLGTVSSISRTVVVPPPLTPPVIANLKLSSGSLSFNLSGAVGQTVVVEVCTNLAAPVWVPMQTNTLDSNPVNFSDPLQPPQQPRRFYRLRSF